MTRVLTPTPAQIVALETYLATGSYVAAAHRLGRSVLTVKRHVRNLREGLGLTTSQAIYVGARDGWLNVEGKLE